MTAPNFTAASARAHAGNVKVDMSLPPSGWSNGLQYTISADMARSLAASLIVAADAADHQAQAVVAPKHTTG